jgi:hypothetical protein
MSYFKETSNPKALNLEILKTSDSKVTLGFKCSPELKLKLAKAALNDGLTLSSYTEMLLNRANQDFEEYQKENKALKDNNSVLTKKIQFYECPTLQNLLLNNKDEIHTFKNMEGKTVNLKVQTLQDAYTVIINSFK